MGRIVYYRVKSQAKEPGTYYGYWKNGDGEVICKTKIVVRPKCDESAYVKYLDRYGMYRFIQFNSYWSRQESAQSLGEVQSVSNYGQTSSIGYDLNEIYTLSLEQVTPEELELYQDIFFSPNIYLKIGDSTEWKPVTIQGSDGVGRRNRKYNSTFTIQLVDSNKGTIIK